jgi:hypothetical protein
LKKESQKVRSREEIAELPDDKALTSLVRKAVGPNRNLEWYDLWLWVEENSKHCAIGKMNNGEHYCSSWMLNDQMAAGSGKSIGLALSRMIVLMSQLLKEKQEVPPTKK